MQRRTILIRLSALALAACSATSASAFTDEPPGRFLPGAYFEYKAQFYLRKGDYKEALRLFELAGFWANKIAQYNVGIMYFNGIGGVPADRIRGTAWLGIAAEQHGETADGALQAAWAELTPKQRADADRIFRELDAKYGDGVAFPRAQRFFDNERNNVTGSRVGFVGDMSVQDNQWRTRPANDFYVEQDRAFNDYTARLGRVRVGEIKSLPLPEDARGRPADPPKEP